MNNNENFFGEFTENIDKMLEHFKKGVIENNRGIKDGVFTPEEVLGDPENTIFIRTYNTISRIMQEPYIAKTFSKAAELLGEEGIKEIALGLISTCTHAVYQSISFYDKLLRDELVKQFDLIVNQTNISKADIIGIKKVLDDNDMATVSILKTSINTCQEEIKRQQDELKIERERITMLIASLNISHETIKNQQKEIKSLTSKVDKSREKIYEHNLEKFLNGEY